MVRAAAALLLVLLIAGCGGGGGPAAGPGPTPSPPAQAADITVLFMGNSHTSVNNLEAMVAALVGGAREGRTVAYVEAPGWMFLEERAVDGPSLQVLRQRNWSFVVLQAQKYSTSGQFVYPTDGAEALVRMARTQHAVPILFPEWPRRGVVETQRIYDLHVSIAQREPACVAPVGQAWDLALLRHPTLALHAEDGNHSAPAGAFLAALIIATTMTGTPPGQFAFLESQLTSVDAETQARLRAIAAETVLAHPPRLWCPADPVR